MDIPARYASPVAAEYRRRLAASLEDGAALDVVPLETPPRPAPKPPVADDDADDDDDPSDDPVDPPAVVSDDTSPDAPPARPEPQWTPDAAAPRCELCRKDFTVVRRRHHCRKCGRCVCSECSPRVCFRPVFPSPVPSRHCKACAPPPARTIAGLRM
mmetsp:Transcript_25493/g.101596  ORF Transcript_25493/g.101596 Transcript_25493/m.101596 type:complete len:157 (-) Transcript_25493:982-1452(-)